MEQREKDIIELCRQVLSATPNTFIDYNYNQDDSTCPFCAVKVFIANAEMDDIKHLTNCAYLIAKDLSTNLL